MAPLLVCVSVPGWRENLHVAADIAVLAAVVVGAIALVLQLRDRRSRRAAVDVRLRTGALQAHRQLKGALDPEHRRANLSLVFATVGAAMDLALRALAADAPKPLAACSTTATAVHRAAQPFARAEERTQFWKPSSRSADSLMSRAKDPGGGGCEARHQSHAASKDTATESSCNASRMGSSSYMMEGPWRGPSGAASLHARPPGRSNLWAKMWANRAKHRARARPNLRRL